MSDIQFKVNDLATLDEVLALARRIFQPSAKEIGEYYDKQDWIGKIQRNGLLIVAYFGNQPAGFVICYPKERDSLHLWIGGVLEDYRRQGLWTGMYEKIERHAREAHFRKLTLNTFRDRFPIMYAFATSHGFVCNRTEMKDGFQKSFFQRTLPLSAGE